MAVDTGVAVEPGPDVTRVVMAEVVRGDSAGKRTIYPPLSLPHLCRRSLASGRAQPLEKGMCLPLTDAHILPQLLLTWGLNACPVAMGSLGAVWSFTGPC